MLSQTAEYALRATLTIANRGDDLPVRASEVARILRIPSNYLSKILHQLAHHGVLVSTRGKRGGFRLGRPAESMKLADIVGLFEEVEQRSRCLLGRPTCSDLHPCAAHARGQVVSNHLSAFFKETTVAQLLENGEADPNEPAHRAGGRRLGKRSRLRRRAVLGQAGPG